MSEQGCRLEVVAGVGRIILDRPGRLNALSLATLQGLHDVALRVVTDPAIKVVTLFGANDAFSAGGDVAEMAQSPEAERQTYLLKGAGLLHEALGLLLRSDKPLLAGVDGVAAGAGFSLVLAADLVVASEEARFTMAYTKIGLTPDGGASYFLPKIVGQHRAMELLLSNRMLTAAEARDWGIVNRLCASGVVADTLDGWAQELASGPIGAFQATKRLVNRGMLQGFEEHVQYERLGIAGRSNEPEFTARLAAFLAKQGGR